MQISSRFTIAIHSLAVIYLYQDQQRVTSNFLSESIQVNPVVVRSVLSGLKAAGIIESRQGSGGSRLAKPLDAITFYDIYVTRMDSSISILTHIRTVRSVAIFIKRWMAN